MFKENLRWWLWVWLTVAVFVIAGIFGFYPLLYKADATFISFGIIVSYALTTSYVAYIIHAGKELKTKYLWYVSSAFEKFGMIGTVIGLIMSFASLFAGIDLSNVENARQLIAVVGTGVSTALYTTAVGMICAFMLETQLAILDRSDEA